MSTCVRKWLEKILVMDLWLYMCLCYCHLWLATDETASRLACALPLYPPHWKEWGFCSEAASLCWAHAEAAWACIAVLPGSCQAAKLNAVVLRHAPLQWMCLGQVPICAVWIWADRPWVSDWTALSLPQVDATSHAFLQRHIYIHLFQWKAKLKAVTRCRSWLMLKKNKQVLVI
jgi:hypothetical protein